MSWKDDVEENIKCGLIEVLILSLLSHEDMYGYRLKTELAERTSYTFIVKEGSLYGPLYRMQERGLISSHKELVGEKRFRNYYHIEEAGKEYLQYAVQQFLLIYDGANQLIQGVHIDDDTKPNGDSEYLKALNKVLVCKGAIKKAILEEIGIQIGEVAQRFPTLTREDLYREVGLPEEVAQGFENREDMEGIRVKAKRYERNRIICCIAVFMAVIAIIFAAVLITSQDDYRSETHVNSDIEEITS